MLLNDARDGSLEHRLSVRNPQPGKRITVKVRRGMDLSATAITREDPMADRIQAGAILIKEGAILPELLHVECDPYSKGWLLVRNLDGYEVEQKTTKAGWNFFYIAFEIKEAVFGFDEEKAQRRSVHRMLTKLKREKFNCLEITQVAVKRFLGLPYVTVSAHPRHIQESVVLFRAQRLAEWDRPQLTAA
jgi:hypothetical protein